MDKAVKLAIIVGILLAGYGVFYHYVIYLPELEQRKAEKERAEWEVAAKRAQEERQEAARRAEAEKEEATRRAQEEKEVAAGRAQKEREEAAKHAQAARSEAARRNVARQSAYYTCLDYARKNYEAYWAATCKEHARARLASLKNCLEDPTIVHNLLMGERWCHSTYGGADPSPNCSLPSSTTDGINKTHDKEKQQCLAEAKLF